MKATRKVHHPHLTPMTGLKEYVARTIASFDRDSTLAQTPQERQDERTSCNIMLWEVDAAQKFHLKSSAMLMIERLMPQTSSRILTLPGTGI